ncbi:hypothetical protein RB195_003356 [Necator americanus]|uniref:Uncharacterized protein n=1 Tax=Necator americanus TaxID=51031 RepID=A0ABR1DQY7_NECAM
MTVGKYFGACGEEEITVNVRYLCIEGVKDKRKSREKEKEEEKKKEEEEEEKKEEEEKEEGGGGGRKTRRTEEKEKEEKNEEEWSTRDMSYCTCDEDSVILLGDIRLPSTGTEPSVVHRREKNAKQNRQQAHEDDDYMFDAVEPLPPPPPAPPPTPTPTPTPPPPPPREGRT